MLAYVPASQGGHAILQQLRLPAQSVKQVRTWGASERAALRAEQECQNDKRPP